MPAGSGLGTAFPDVACGHQVQMAASPIFVYRDFGWAATPRMTRAQLIKVGEHILFRYDSGVHWNKQFADLADSGLA
jgi:hypothetical protein